MPTYQPTAEDINPLYNDIYVNVSHPKEEHRLRVSENRELRRMFGPKEEEVTGGWRKLHNEEVHISILFQILTG
jgi:hypothetical protein